MKTLAYGLMALSLLVSGPAMAQHDHSAPADAAEIHAGPAITLGDLELSAAFTRASLPNQPAGGGYVTITNTGDTEDRLVAAETAIAGHTEIHEMSVENDIMTMRELPDGIVIPAGETVTLEPGGLHLMFMDLQDPIVEGTPVVVTLEFETAGSVEIELSVAPAGARGAHSDHSGH